MKTLVIAEVKGHSIKKVSFELLSQCKRWGVEAHALLIGSEVGNLVDELAAYGAQKVYVAEDPSLDKYLTSTYAQLVVDAVNLSGAELVLMSGSEMGKDLAPRVAAKLDTGAITDAKSITIEGEQIKATQLAYAGKVLNHVQFKHPKHKVISVQPGTFELGEKTPGAKAQVENLSLPQSDLRAVIREVLKETSEKIDLGEANIVVAGGRGMKGPEGVKLLEELAETLGAAIGGSRAVCDSGLMPHTCQVGQTGRVVAPQVYIAIGISGAIQHLAGMSGSKAIVAINTDPDAPIFNVADFGIVADLFEAVPLLIAEFKKLKAGTAAAAH